MQAFRFIHTADLHLDQPMNSWKDPGCLAERRRDYRLTFQRMVDLVLDRKATFFLIVGDFLEHGYVDRSTIDFVMEELKRIPDTYVFVAPGNHDPYRTDSCYRTLQWPEHVHFFSEIWENHYFPEYDLRLYGKGFADFVEKEKSLPTVYNSGERRMMVAHGTLMDSEKETDYFPMVRSELAGLEMDYVALGHIHQPSFHRLDNVRKTWIRYPGSPEALNWKETGERTVTVGTMDEQGVQWESVSIQSRRHEIRTIDVTGCETDGQVSARIMRQIPTEEKSDCICFQLKGFRPSEVEFRPQHIVEELKAEGFFYVECMDKTEPDLDLEQLRKEGGVLSAFIHLMERKMNQADSFKEKTMLEAALYRGVSLLLKEGNHR
ncbi:metallophosphoesterase family protein [Melghirimyces algeriensis]|uniref:DNA repair exonuclease SbcCD nuclease subunit n=1 Tax=Melghirimyces algeriensis TaxID=910412 RepID=A0A521EQE5_9BACL|nr:DNA repair exonuclease [Melghirimyces algeriensis]SMO86147.1 DNA repair exonuclease SbcCD nuclease subunit [Melghirimyces algeriensis]